MKKHRKLDIIAIVLTIILLMTICMNVCVYIYKIISPLVQNKRVQKEYEELIKQRDEQLANIRKTKTEASKKKLKELGIRIVAEDTGLNYGRTVVLDCNTGDFMIKSVGKENKII